MHDEITKYTNKLLRDRTAVPDSIRFYRCDEVIVASREDEWLPVFSEVLNELNAAALLFAKPSLPFADLLVKRAERDSTRLVPRDSETRVFLHDIPFVREQEWKGKPKADLAQRIAACLKGRKAAIIEGLGVVATGGITVEQAFIGFSSIFHTAFVKYLLDLLVEGFKFPEEKNLFGQFRSSWLREPDLSGISFDRGPLSGREAIMNEICRVGRYTVEKGYVDSFFGNISYFDGETIFISQTASSLDELEGHIDPVPLDGSSTAGLSASSELPAHRGVYVSSNYRAILHGHPRFSIVLSMYCKEEGCSIQDCNRFCDRRRSVCGVPIIAGETGVGGLAKSVPTAISETGVCIAYGHGIFAAAEKDFEQAFMRMAGTENQCREEYFRLVEQRNI